MALLTTSAGWLPKPAELRRARCRFAEGEIDEKALRQAEERATSAGLALQETIGLDLLVDGQFDRSDLLGSYAERIEGLEAGALVRCFGNRYHRRPRIVGALGRTAPLTVESWRAASVRTEKPLKALLTGPYTLMDGSFDEHYRSRERAAMAFAGVLREEVEALLAAGAEEIHLDEPAIGVRPEELSLAVAALAQVTEPLAGKARAWAHLCYGDPLPVIAELFALPVDVLSLELSHAPPALLEALDDLPGTKRLAAGVIDVVDPAIEDAATLLGRVERVLAHVPAERLWLSTDAGLHALDAEVARAKLAALVAAGA